MSPAIASFPALGTTAEVVVADPAALPAARRAVERRARPDRRRVQPLPRRLRAERPELRGRRSGAHRPRADAGPRGRPAGREGDVAAPSTRRSAPPCAAAGYDRDFAALPADGPAVRARPAPGWRALRLTASAGRPCWRRGPGSTSARRPRRWPPTGPRTPRPSRPAAASSSASAATSPCAAALPARDGRSASPTTIATAGRPSPCSCARAAWPRRARRCAAGAAAARRSTTSSTRAPGARRSPSGAPSSVAAPSCVAANTLSTAAIVWGADAPLRLRAAGVPARLVGEEGEVVTTGGWPD